MNLHLLNEYSADNLGDAAIYQTLSQLAMPLAVRSALAPEQRRHAPGLQGAAPPSPGDAWLSVGGDIFNNARPSLLTRRFAANVWRVARAPARHTFLFGQSIPDSCRGAALGLLLQALRRLSSVTVRDVASQRRLREGGVSAQLSWDLAFAYRPGPAAAADGRRLLDSAGVDPERAVLVSVREFDAMYPHDNARFVASIAALCERLRRRGHAPALLVQAQAVGADNDRRVIERIVQVMPGLPVVDPFAAAGTAYPVDALVGALGLARGVVAVRYHTAVLRLLSGRVPYSLHYAGKGRDLAQRLALPGGELADLDPASAVAELEASLSRHVQAHQLGAQVREAFADRLCRALGQPTGAVAGARS